MNREESPGGRRPGELAIGYATLKRLLDARLYLTNDSEQAMLVPTTTCDDGIVYDGILVTY